MASVARKSIEQAPNGGQMWLLRLGLYMPSRRKEQADDWSGSSTTPSRSGHAKATMRQTKFAFLLPPELKAKARWMNLDALVAWSRKAIDFVLRTAASLLDDLLKP